jgi:hypothetical protein
MRKETEERGGDKGKEVYIKNGPTVGLDICIVT